MRPSLVSHFRLGGSNIRICCDALPVNPGDIIVTDKAGWRGPDRALTIGFGEPWDTADRLSCLVTRLLSVHKFAPLFLACDREHADLGPRQDSDPHNYCLRRSKRFAGGEKQGVGRDLQSGAVPGGISLRCRDRRARMGCFWTHRGPKGQALRKMAARHIPAGRWPHLDVGDQDPELNRIYRNLAIYPSISMTAFSPVTIRRGRISRATLSCWLHSKAYLSLSLITCFAFDAHAGELK